MARRNDSSSKKLTPLSDGPIVEALGRLWEIRLTKYQQLCLRLGGLALEFPLGPFGDGPARSGARFRHSDQFPHEALLMRWALDVADQNLLAGLVLLDALECFDSLRRLVLPGPGVPFPSSREKTQWTQNIGEFDVEFVAPEGWTFILDHVVHPAGFRGVAGVRRCHLTQDSYRTEHGLGSLAGLADRQVESVIGFDIPCVYHPGVQIVDDRIHIDKASSGCGSEVSIPYDFVVRAFRRPSRFDEPLKFTPRPTDEEVVDLAEQSVKRMQERSDAETHEV